MSCPSGGKTQSSGDSWWEWLEGLLEQMDLDTRHYCPRADLMPIDNQMIEWDSCDCKIKTEHSE